MNWLTALLGGMYITEQQNKKRDFEQFRREYLAQEGINEDWEVVPLWLEDKIEDEFNN